MDDLAAPFALSGSQAFSDLPVEGGLEGVFHGRRATRDEEGVRQALRDGDAGEGVDETGHLDGVEVGIGRVVDRHPAEPLEESRIRHPRVVMPDGVCREIGKAVQKHSSGAGAAHPGAVAFVEIEHQIEPVRNEVPAEYVVDFGGVRGPAKQPPEANSRSSREPTSGGAISRSGEPIDSGRWSRAPPAFC